MLSPRLTVIGTGYLGATHAVCMAVLGFEVLGVDVDERKVARLASGEVPFFEPGLPELLVKALESGRLRTVLSEAVWAAFRRTIELGDQLEASVGESTEDRSGERIVAR